MPPFDTKMAHKHKKGLSDKQARQWADVATSTYEKCTKAGGAAKDCEAKAIRAANGVTGKPTMKRNLQTISLTVHQTSDLIRYEEFEGRRHLIAPCVAIIEGVLNNYFVSAEEIGKYVQSWAGLPLPLGHPIQDGVALSANSPAIIAASVIGRFWNPQFDGTRLSGELWVDIEKAKHLSDGLEVLRRLEAGEALEISTAFWADVDPMPGTFKGQSYAGAHQNLVPDHLALLPHDIGACSVQMGCGAPRINCATCKGACMQHHDTDPLVKRFAAFFAGLFKAAEGMEDATPGGEGLQTHLTDSDIRQALQSALRREKEDEQGQMGGMYHDCYVMDVEDEQVIYSENGKTYRRPFTIDDENRVMLSGEATEVQQDTRYIPVTNAAGAGNVREDLPPTEEKGAESVDKTPVINALISCAKGTWQEKDRPLLETLEHAVLVRMQEEIEARQDEEPEEDDEQEQEEAPAETAEATVTTQAQQPVTLEAITQMVTQAVSAAMDARLETFGQQMSERQERQQLTSQLTTHGWTNDELADMQLIALRKLAATVAPASFMGMGLPAFATQAQDDGPPDDPDWK